jgi:hypothetical protein
MIVLGHAPAWLHVGICEGHGHPSVDVAAEETVSVCSHGCVHHESSQEVADTTSGTYGSPVSDDQHQHDSDTCVVCQSLASPNGVTWELLVSLPAEFVSQPAFFAAETALPATFLSIPQPRGPPVVA